jgi:prepilin-type N-terminal cleavage/methylation domain-containing protein
MKETTVLGMSLIEVMISILIVSIIAGAGLKYSLHSGRIIEDQKQNRLACATACRRMELLLATPYQAFVTDRNAVGVGIGTYFFEEYDPNRREFDPSKSDPEEQVSINNWTGDVQTRVRFVTTQSPGDTAANLCLEIEVEVYFGSGSQRSVYLKSYHAGS